MDNTAPLIIIGAGGHGRVAADTACESGWNVSGFLDLSLIKGTQLNGIEVLGDGKNTEPFSDFTGHAFFVGIGNGSIRWREFNTLTAAGLPVPNIIHPFTHISSSASIGRGTLVAAGAVVQANVQIGDAAIINTGARIDHDCQIGNGAMIAPGCVLCGDVIIGAHAFIGAGSIVTPGVTIGDGAFVGAGSVVIENIAKDAVHKPFRKLSLK
ncbi:acetyltransferase [Thalassospira xianhensis]|uniref:PglD N-terminal domain-containing protein n=1 Tax=Thalassospira xianhensis MCCC 1A02616 TaxID=1177929 RepID=A0A367UJ88_9PROT|nr:acetyltransferase [Thalassospira xianhensis]RCK07374.1 hypothetical protein TH5_03010 [Thalassospira xianhensis MCCC 1A02616]